MARRTTGGVPKEILAEREEQSWSLRQKGYTHQRIADEIGLERSTVTKMLGRLTGRVIGKLDEIVKEQTLAQIDQLSFIVDEMFQAWQHSKEAQKSVSKRTTAGAGKFNKVTGEELTVQTEDQDGNTRYIAEARAAMADIRKILGVDAPTKINQDGEVVFRIIHDDMGDGTKIHLPNYHSKQRDFITSKAKRKCIVAGRRSGKTMGVSGNAAEDLLGGRRVLYAAPTSDQTSTFGEIIKRFLQEPIAAGFIYKNETDRVLEIKGGGRIRAKTAWNADTLRGDYADKLILEEYSIMDPTTWEEVGAPMLLDNNGDAIFIFTPKRKNHAWQLYQRAIGDTSGRWQAWHFTSHDNPYLSKEALEEITQDMTEAAYQQEILAQFLESEGQVFRNLAACMNAPKDATPKDHEAHRLVAGLDWAKQNDFTFTSIVCSDCRVEVDKDRFNKIDYHFQRDRLRALYERWQVSHIEGEANSIGEPNIEELQRDGLPVVGFQTTASSKPPLIESLALCFERVECQWLDDPVCTGELESYELKMSANTNRPTYSAPSGMNDDTVIGRALAWRGVLHGAGVEVFEVNW